MTLKKIAPYIWEITKEGSMHVPGRIFASEKLIRLIERDKTIEQVKNVARLPGILTASMAMPDAHQGYGGSIGAVSAFDLITGVISPGLIGYDINCGVRLLISNLTKTAFLKKRAEILQEIYTDIPSGVKETAHFTVSDSELKAILEKGVGWALQKGYAISKDSQRIEDAGCIVGADASAVSERALLRGKNHLGTLGSGNHFIEVQEVERILNPSVARAFGLKKGAIAIMIHCGSRGLGHQVASDYIQAMGEEYGFEHLPDRGLASAPLDSRLGKKYRAAMAAAANFAFVNRQLIAHQLRRCFEKHIPTARLETVYDVAHNIAKFEKHTIDGKIREVCVHRKGATRSFGPGRKEIPSFYRKVGQPVLLPGSMGTYSYVLVGTREAELLTFGSTAHGAGRVFSRTYALEHITPADVEKQLKIHDVLIKAGSRRGMVEEAPDAYKDIDEVARVSDALHLGNLVVRLKPLAVVKG